jgi:DNA modification methylase
MTWSIYHGDCLEYLESLPENSVDAIVTDPPYGLSPDGKARTWDDLKEKRGRGGFMGRAWDSAVPGVTWARACLRVLKPGGHLIAFASTRTIHRLTVSVEDAGFEIRDQIAWLQWQGFPKSLDVSKAIDQHYGAERAVVGKSKGAASSRTNSLGVFSAEYDATAPATADAKKWEGWGTALKPSQEPAILARKPLEGTVAENVLRWGVGGLNIDGCRYAYGDPAWPGPGDETATRLTTNGSPFAASSEGGVVPNTLGRWPANIYQCPKASRSEREAGCEELPGRSGAAAVERKEGSAGLNNPRAGAGRTAESVRNSHPTVKPIELMRWLVRLVTPEGGKVLDPFTGSGTTGIAAVLEGRDFLGAEMNDTAEEPFVSIAEARISYWQRHGENALEVAGQGRKEGELRKALEAAGQIKLF